VKSAVRECLAGLQSRRRAQPGWTPGEHGNDECGPARHSPEGLEPQQAHAGVAHLAKAASFGCGARLVLHLLRFQRTADFTVSLD